VGGLGCAFRTGPHEAELSDPLGRFHRYEGALERAFHRNVRLLLMLQSLRQAVPVRPVRPVRAHQPILPVQPIQPSHRDELASAPPGRDAFWRTDPLPAQDLDEFEFVREQELAELRRLANEEAKAAGARQAAPAPSSGRLKGGPHSSAAGESHRLAPPSAHAPSHDRESAVTRSWPRGGGAASETGADKTGQNRAKPDIARNERPTNGPQAEFEE
jgi:hypothetical protein